jgi:hypothetical protein
MRVLAGAPTTAPMVQAERAVAAATRQIVPACLFTRKRSLRAG